MYPFSILAGTGSTPPDVAHHMDNTGSMNRPPIAHSGHGGHGPPLFPPSHHPSQPSTPAPRHQDMNAPMGGSAGGGMPGTPTPTPVSNPTTSPLVVPQPMKARTIKTYHCRMCDQEFPNKSEMTRHSKDVHGMEEKGHKCPKCFKSFPTSQQLAQHSLVHTNIRKFHCHYCDKTFKQLSHVQQHQRIHTGERPYKCTVETCGKAFAQLANLQQHLKNHDVRSANSDKKPYSCTTCDRRFATEASLNHHVTKVHVFKRTQPMPNTAHPKQVSAPPLSLPMAVSTSTVTSHADTVSVATTSSSSSSSQISLPPLQFSYLSSSADLQKASEAAVVNLMRHSLFRGTPQQSNANQVEVPQVPRLTTPPKSTQPSSTLSAADSTEHNPKDMHSSTSIQSPSKGQNQPLLSSYQFYKAPIIKPPEQILRYQEELAKLNNQPQKRLPSVELPREMYDWQPTVSVQSEKGLAPPKVPADDQLRQAPQGAPTPDSTSNHGNRLSDLSKKDLNLLKLPSNKLFSFPSQVAPLSPTLYTEKQVPL